jgi:hypothetical protein
VVSYFYACEGGLYYINIYHLAAASYRVQVYDVSCKFLLLDGIVEAASLEHAKKLVEELVKKIDGAKRLVEELCGELRGRLVDPFSCERLLSLLKARIIPPLEEQACGALPVPAEWERGREGD